MFKNEPIVTDALERIARLSLAMGRKPKPYIILLDTIQSSKEVAYMLKSEWHGCNSISIPFFDLELITATVQITKAEFCYFGDCCELE